MAKGTKETKKQSASATIETFCREQAPSKYVKNLRKKILAKILTKE